MAKKKPYRFVLYLLVKVLASLFYLLPRRVLMKIARSSGRLGFYLVPRQRKKVLAHLHRVYAAQKSEAEMQRMARGVFEHLAMTAAEVLQFSKLTLSEVRKIVDAEEALEVYNGLLKEGHGLISMTAHLGNWELLAGVFGLQGFQGGVLARRIYYERYNRWIVGLRKSLGIQTVYRDDSSRTILKMLKQNQIVGLLPDQDIAGLPGIFVDFFGKPAYTPVAPVKLCLASGAPILCNFLVHQPGDRYKLIIGEIIRPDPDMPKEKFIETATRRWMKNFEQVIREYPDQWAWMHDRWKTRPTDELPVDRKSNLTLEMTAE